MCELLSLFWLTFAAVIELELLFIVLFSDWKGSVSCFVIAPAHRFFISFRSDCRQNIVRDEQWE